MSNSPREILERIYSTPLAALQPQLDSASAHLSRMSPTWRETLLSYEQPPAPLREFVESPLYLNLEGRVYPQVLETLEAVFTPGPTGATYTEAAICWGIGSGKSFLSSLALSYLLHRTLCLRDPQSHYGLAPGSQIAFLIMGASATQAQRVVFSEVRRRVTDSPWFRAFCGKDLQPLATEIRFPKQVFLVAGNSAETCPLGYNLLGAVLDEAAWLTETADGRYDAAEEIYHALQRRIHSRFFDQGLLLLISSPRHVGDFIERKLAEAERSPRLYASRRAIWEVKPARLYRGETFDFADLKVPVEYREDFERNPERALRDLAARATASYCAWFSEPALLTACVDSARTPALAAGDRWRPDLRAPDRLPRFLHVDLGLRHDACGLALVHCRPAPDRPGEPEVHADLVCRLRAPENGELDFSRVRDLIQDLTRRGYALAQVSFDGWQSVDSRQILRRQGLRTALVSVDRDLSAYETLRELVQAGRLRLPPDEDLQRELRSLELVRGAKVDHPRGGSKDMSDALAAAASEAVKAWGGGVVGGRVV
ncbi:MAG TPA: hypothetical protein VGM19_11110 [Armatimonadota bacterium]|jgi:hypothetical protein